MRISKKDFNSEGSKIHGPQDMWHHVDCFNKNRVELGFGSDFNPEK